MWAYWLQLIPEIIFGLVVAVCAALWWRRRQGDRYDLRRLHGDDDPPGEAYDDMVADDSGPYCAACDEPYPAGTRVCRRCGRGL